MNIVDGFLQVNGCDDETLARWARRAEERCGLAAAPPARCGALLLRPTDDAARMVWHELYRGVDDPWILRGAVSALARGVATCDLEKAQWRLLYYHHHQDAGGAPPAAAQYKLHIVEAALQRAHTEERIGYISPPLLWLPPLLGVRRGARSASALSASEDGARSAP